MLTWCPIVTGLHFSQRSTVLVTTRSRTKRKIGERHLPLLGGLILGNELPTEYRMEAEEGWLAFKTNTGPWRAIPWSVDAWRGLAKDVFVPCKADENPKAGEQFRRAYRLILGSASAPPDRALKGEDSSLPSGAKGQDCPGNQEKK